MTDWANVKKYLGMIRFGEDSLSEVTLDFPGPNDFQSGSDITIGERTEKFNDGLFVEWNTSGGHYLKIVFDLDLNPTKFMIDCNESQAFHPTLQKIADKLDIPMAFDEDC